MNCTEKGAPYPHICFVLHGPAISRFYTLLQRGVRIRGGIGCSVSAFLRDTLGVTNDELEKIQSIFLDGSPVDDLDSAKVRDGSRLALSAAMPGLVGATLRRGGVYSSFRSTISHKESEAPCEAGDGLVELKIFNLLMDDLGPGVLRKSVLVKSSDLRDFLAALPPEFSGECSSSILDGRPVDAMSLANEKALSGHDIVSLSVMEEA